MFLYDVSIRSVVHQEQNPGKLPLHILYEQFGVHYIVYRLTLRHAFVAFLSQSSHLAPPI